MARPPPTTESARDIGADAEPAGAAAGRGAKIKGTGFREFVGWYRERHGDEALLRILTSPEVAPHWPIVPGSATMIGILPSVWYPTERVSALLESILGAHEREEREEILDGGAAAIIAGTLRGAYRVLFDMIGTPERYAKFATRLWMMFHDAGRVDARWVTPTCLELHIADWPGHQRATCEISMLCARHIFIEMGMLSVAVERTSCIADGSPRCLCAVRFERPR